MGVYALFVLVLLGHDLGGVTERAGTVFPHTFRHGSGCFCFSTQDKHGEIDLDFSHGVPQWNEWIPDRSPE